ncbi:MAG TPA: ABC transporter permease [Candidatus Acidoferrales bacterium]|nr:ABC transporter permease [Candidatus Acidoferrales bacterium]
MSLRSRLRSWTRTLLRRSHAESDMDNELHSHIENYADDLTRTGIPREEALRRARAEFGGIERVKEECRESRGISFTESALQDLRFAFRMLRKSPGFTAVAVLTLALGIGANTAIFSAVNAILFESLPYPHPERVMAIPEVNRDGSRAKTSFGMYRELATRNRSFDALSLFASWQPTVTANGEPQRLEGQRVSWSYFRALGVSPFLGRDFQASDDVLDGPNVVILGYALWQKRFGGDPSIIGNQIKIGETSGTVYSSNDMFTVIGVAPRSFENVLSPSAELWAPLQIDISQHWAWGHWLDMIGRLRPGTTVNQATQELTALGAQVIQTQHPPTYGKEVRYSVISLQDEVTRGVRSALLAVLSAVMLVLLIACVNVTNLLLARGSQRRGEFAMRAALGAGPARLTRQLLTESLLLALIGGVLGLIAAQFGVQAIVALSPPDLPRLSAIQIDRNVFLFALGITTVIGILIGLIPAFRASRNNNSNNLKEVSRQTVGSQRVTRHVLVVAEVAFALVLLVSAGLLLRSLERLFAVPPGFDASRVLSMQIDEVGHRYDPDPVRYRFWVDALDAVKRVPGVESAAFTNALPLSGDGFLDQYGVNFEIDHNPDKADDAMRYAVTPGYFQTMKIPLKRGRFLNEGDRAGAPAVALISESFAKRKFGSTDPLGQRVHIGSPDFWFTVVGVVGNVKQMSLALSEPDAVYTTVNQWQWIETSMSLVVRAHGNAAALAPDIRKAIWSVDKDLPISRVETMDDLIAASAAERQFTLILFEAFGIVALALAAVGIYGVLSGSVTERTREIGIRLALGASPRSILSLIILRGMKLTALGVVIGLAGALAAGQAIASQLFGISPLDVATYSAVTLLLAGIAAIACWIPAQRAARVDPMVALRYE